MLLRVLQDGEIRRLGENRTKRLDLRVVAATNRPLDGEAAAGRIRKDLLYRLGVVELTALPLDATGQQYGEQPQQCDHGAAAHRHEGMREPAKALERRLQVLDVEIVDAAGLHWFLAWHARTSSQSVDPVVGPPVVLRRRVSESGELGVTRQASQRTRVDVDGPPPDRPVHPARERPADRRNCDTLHSSRREQFAGERPRATSVTEKRPWRAGGLDDFLQHGVDLPSRFAVAAQGLARLGTLRAPWGQHVTERLH